MSKSPSTSGLRLTPPTSSSPFASFASSSTSPIAAADGSAMQPREMIKKLYERLEFQLGCVNEQMNFFKKEASTCTKKAYEAQKSIELYLKLIKEKEAAIGSVEKFTHTQDQSDQNNEKEIAAIQMAIEAASREKDLAKEITARYVSQLLPLKELEQQIQQLLDQMHNPGKAGLADSIDFMLQDAEGLRAKMYAGGKITIAWVAGMAAATLATGGAVTAIGGAASMLGLGTSIMASAFSASPTITLGGIVAALGGFAALMGAAGGWVANQTLNKIVSPRDVESYKLAKNMEVADKARDAEENNKRIAQTIKAQEEKISVYFETITPRFVQMILNQKSIDRALEIFKQCPEMYQLAFYDGAKEWQNVVNLVLSIKAACKSSADKELGVAPCMSKYWKNFSSMSERLYPDNKALQQKLMFSVAAEILRLGSKDNELFTQEERAEELLNIAYDIGFGVAELNDAVNIFCTKQGGRLEISIPKGFSSKVLQDREDQRNLMIQDHLLSIIQDLDVLDAVHHNKNVPAKLKAFKAEYELIFNKNTAEKQLAQLVHDLINYHTTAPKPGNAEAQQNLKLIFKRIKLLYQMEDINEILYPDDEKAADAFGLRVIKCGDEISSFVTLDLAKVYDEVHQANGNTVLNGFHALYSLGANIHIKPLKELKEALKAADGKLHNSDLIKFEKPLFDVLRGWAYSESGFIKDIFDPKDSAKSSKVKIGKYDVYNRYQNIFNSQNPNEAKMEFIKYCAALASNDGELWTHNHCEKIAAIALLSILEGKTPEEIEKLLDQASNDYHAACEGQVAKDIVRDKVLVDLDGRKLVIDGTEILEQSVFQELSGAQIGFIRLICDQGKTLGVFTEITASSLRNVELGGVMHQTLGMSDDRIICLIKDGGSIYMVMTGLYHKKFDNKSEPIVEFNPENPDHGGWIKVSILYDISELNGTEFGYGFGPQIPIRMIIEASEANLRSLQIPSSLRDDTTSLDKCLEEKVLENMKLRKAWIEYIDHMPLPEKYSEAVTQCSLELEKRYELLRLKAPVHSLIAEGNNECKVNVNLKVDDNGYVDVLLGVSGFNDEN